MPATETATKFFSLVMKALPKFSHCRLSPDKETADCTYAWARLNTNGLFEHHALVEDRINEGILSAE